MFREARARIARPVTGAALRRESNRKIEAGVFLDNIRFLYYKELKQQGRE